MGFEAIERRGTDCSKWDGLTDKFGRDDILALWVADMDLPAPAVAQSAITKRAKHPVYGYTIYSREFYQSIIGWYRDQFKWDIDKEWIVAEHGVVVSLNQAIDAFSSDGDGIMVQTPIYPPFISAVKNRDRVLLDNRLLYENGRYSIDFNDFEQKAKQASIFLLCSPHNPTTRAWKPDELTKIVDICYENGVIIVSDEIHSDLVFGSRHIPIASIPKAKEITVTLHAPSKTFNIAGLNTSYLIIENQELREKYSIVHSRVGLDNGNPFGIVALEAVYSGAQKWLMELKEQIEENSRYIKTFIKEMIPEIKVCDHEATFLIWLDCKGLKMSDRKLMDFFVFEASLGLNSGLSFGESGSGFMRLNIGTSKAILEEAMNRLLLAIEKIRK